jgi:hypothetical protein
MHRQGDILFIKVEALPQGIHPKEGNIIVEGESTGHAHRLQSGSILIHEIHMFLNIPAETSVVHEEHHPIVLEPGYWQVIRQREYIPGAIRQVAD